MFVDLSSVLVWIGVVEINVGLFEREIETEEVVLGMFE
jgi:hypothetical protein